MLNTYLKKYSISEVAFGILEFPGENIGGCLFSGGYTDNDLSAFVKSEEGYKVLITSFKNRNCVGKTIPAFGGISSKSVFVGESHELAEYISTCPAGAEMGYLAIALELNKANRARREIEKGFSITKNNGNK